MIDENKIEFSEILSEYLLNHSMTQSSYAQKICIKQSQVSEWLSGKAKPGYEMLKRIAATFEFSADYWLGLSDK